MDDAMFVPQRFSLVSSSQRFGPEPDPDDEVEQHLSVCDDGRVFVSHYVFGDMPRTPKLSSKQQLRIDVDVARKVMDLVGDYLASDEDKVDCFDVGYWSLKVVAKDGTRLSAEGPLIDEASDRLDAITRLVREALGDEGLYVFG